MNINIRVYFLLICVIIITCIATSIQGSDLLPLPNFRSIGKFRRQAECGNKEFKCYSGQCINDELLCDSKVDCIDGSDEASKQCLSIPCAPQTSFRCNYGGCLPKSVKCNGVQDCIDGSDEKNCPSKIKLTTLNSTKISTLTTKSSVTPMLGTCLIPKHPSNGEYGIGNTTDLKPGDYAPLFSIIETKCKKNYKVNPLVTNIYPVCINGQWSQVPPSCERACPPIHPSSTTNVKCKYNGIPVPNCDDPVEGTTASFECKPFYEERGITTNPGRVCKDGSWDNYIPNCLPLCGYKRPQRFNQVGERIAKENDYPWHVGVYQTDDTYICGGSIISLKVILSAAHCFSDPDGNQRPIEEYKIAGGKYYRAFNDPRDKNVQTSLVSAIHLPERYKGIINNYEADIAVVVLQTPFQVSMSVQPVCLDRTPEFEYLQFAKNRVGMVVGWEYTDQDGNLSNELKEINVLLRSYPDCYEKFKPTFRKFLTHDKICAEYLFKNKSVCLGESGRGITFELTENHYYIQGISSTLISSGVETCDAEVYGTYTLISKHIKFITEIVDFYRA